MRTRLFLVGICAIFAFTFFPHKSFATHAMGLDLSWECIGTNEYRFTLNFYRDCDGVSAPGSVTINLNSVSCGQSASVFAPLVVGSGQEVSPLCPSQLGNSACNSGTLPGVQQYTYQGTVTLPASCPDWVVSFDECCRNTTITNLVNPSSQSALVTGVLNNTLAACNSSPQFTSLPVPYICEGQPFCYNHGAVDPDGDSLVYTLVDPLDGPVTTTPPYGNPIAHSGGLSAGNPIANSAFAFDPATGSMCLTPVGVQKAVVAIRVDEYRNGVLIGYTTRDIQVVVQNCVNVQPDHVPRDLLGVVGGVRLDSNSIEICPGVPMSFDIIFADGNPGDSISLVTNLGTVIPAANFTTSYISPNDTIVGTFSWTPTTGDVGFHSFTVTIQDDGCPILGAQIFNYDIFVIESTEATPSSSAYCTAGSPVQINTVGGSTFTWNTLSGDAGGLSCTNCPNPQASPNTSSVYEVVSDLSAACKNRDTITVDFVPSFVLAMSNDTTICANGIAQISGLATPGGLGPFTYNWSPADSLSSTTVFNPVADPQDTTRYFLTATSAGGCVITDSVDVNVSGTAPQVTILPLDTLCTGDSQLIETVISQTCGVTANPCTGPVNNGTVGTTGGAFDANTSPANYSGVARTNRSQIIYLKSELDAIGFAGGGRINSIVLNFANAGGTAVPDLEIKMGCTTLNEFTNLAFTPGLSTVKNPFVFLPATGGQTVVLDNPYIWDGQSNLIIEFCSSTPTAGSTSFFFATNFPAVTRTRFASNTSGGACAIVNGTLGNNVPVMGFNFCESLPPGLTYSWTPATGLSATNIPEPTANPAATTTYTFSVDDGLCVGSDVATLEVAPSFSVSVGNDTTLCRNLPLQMNGTVPPGFGPYTFNWTPGNLGVSDSTIANPTILAPDTTTYIFSAKSAAGCEVSDTITINIDGISPLVDAGLNDTICPGSTVGLTTLVSQACGPTSDPCAGPLVLSGVGDSTTTTFLGLTGPFYNSAGGTNPRTQYIILASELTAMGYTGGKITQLAFDVGGSSTAPFATTDLALRIGCTSLNEFPASLVFEGGLTTVFSSAAFTPVIGRNFITLTTQFNWDGTSNLVIEICHNVSRVGGNDCQVKYSNSPNRVLTASLGGGNNCVNPVGDFRLGLRPVIFFRFCSSTPAGLTYLWSPTTGLSNPNIDNPNATPTQTTTYSVLVSDGGPCNGQDFVTVAIDSTNFVEATSDTIVVCPGDSAFLDAVVTGPPRPATFASCGVNGTPCTNTAYQVEIADPARPGATTVTPFRSASITDFRMQNLLLASDIIANGGASGIIMNLALEVTAVTSSNPYNDFTIKLGCTSLNALTGVNWEPTQTVFVASNFSPTVGWNTFNFSFPFDWDGTSNIVVEICFNNSVASGGTDPIRDRSTSYVASQFRSTTTPTDDGCAFATPTSSNIVMPNYRMVICNPQANTFSYAWAPGSGLSSTNVQSPIAKPAATTTYAVTVTGGTCTVVDTITLQVPGTCALPLDGLLLEGSRAGSQHFLEFASLNERGMQSYQVERAGEDRNYASLGIVPAKGSFEGKTDYSFVDILPLPGENWYRIRGINQNGMVDFSNEIILEYTSESAIHNIYPNPVKGGESFLLDYYAAQDEQVNLEVVDMLGRVILTDRFAMLAGLNQREIPTRQLPAGSYFVRVRNGAQTLSKKVMVIR